MCCSRELCNELMAVLSCCDWGVGSELEKVAKSRNKKTPWCLCQINSEIEAKIMLQPLSRRFGWCKSDGLTLRI